MATLVAGTGSVCGVDRNRPMGNSNSLFDNMLDMKRFNGRSNFDSKLTWLVAHVVKESHT
jgi:hypothetical protein